MVPPIKKPRLSALLLILARILQDMLRMAKKNTPGDNDFSLLVKLVLFEKLQKSSSYIRMKLRRLECPLFSDLRKKRWISAWNLQDEATLITFFMVVEDTAFWKHWAFSDPVLLWIVVFDAGQRCVQNSMDDSNFQAGNMIVCMILRHCWFVCLWMMVISQHDLCSAMQGHPCQYSGS